MPFFAIEPADFPLPDARFLAFGVLVAWAIHNPGLDLSPRSCLEAAYPPRKRVNKSQMAPNLKEKVADRNRRQRVHARELRIHAMEHRLVSQGLAKRKIERSRRRLGDQVARSRQMAQRA